MDSSSQRRIVPPELVWGPSGLNGLGPCGDRIGLAAASVTGDGYGALLQSIIAARGKRFEFFPSSLFADPAWDIMLHAALAHEQQRRITVSALSAAVNAPDTTAARWIRHMVEQQILVYRNAPTDARIKYVELSTAAAAKLRTYLRQISDASPV